MLFKNSNLKYKRDKLNKNFGLTEAKFNSLKEALKKGNESLMVHIYEHQVKLSISFLMEDFAVTYNDAYDICMETLVELREKLIAGKAKYGNLKFLFTRMAKNNLIDFDSRQRKINGCIEVFLDGQEKHMNTNDFLETLHLSIQQLKDEEQRLINDLFLGQNEMQDLAVSYGISYSNVRKKKERILAKLKKEFFKILDRQQ